MPSAPSQKHRLWKKIRKQEHWKNDEPKGSKKTYFSILKKNCTTGVIGGWATETPKSLYAAKKTEK